MNLPLMIACAVLVSSAATLILVLRQLLRNDRRGEIEAEWLKGFSVSRYRVMERLLSRPDCNFLKAQQGYDKALERHLRLRRCIVFRRYLSCLMRDFGRLETAILLYAAAAQKDQPHLVKAIMVRRLVFTWAVCRAEWCLLVFRFGLGSGHVGELVSSLYGLRLELGQVVICAPH